MTRYDDPEEPYYIGEVIGSAQSYHRPTCHVIQRIRRRNHKRLRDSKEAQDLGLSPCSHCRPYTPESEMDNAQPAHGSTATAPLSGSPPLSHSTILTSTQLSDLRRELLRVIDLVDAPGNRPPGESVSGRIGRLTRATLIPRNVAAAMRVITETRNLAEYDAKTLSEAESDVVLASWKAVKEWAASRGSRPSDGGQP